MNVIKVEIKNKKAVRTNETAYVCDNSKYTVVFSFDEEWDEFEVKTARFVYGDKHQDVVFTGNECEMPIISNTKLISVGVFAGNLQTTTPAFIVAYKSILGDDSVPEEPPEDVYNQIMEKCNEAVDTAKKVEAETKDLAEDVEDVITHQPIIVQNNWWVWDAEKKIYVDTGVRATVDIVQTTGESETEVMSQKATTKALVELANKVAPSPASVSIYADEWEQDDEEPRWHQVVEVANATITPRSKVDLQPSAEQLTVFYEKSLAFVTENDNGVVTVYCIGQKPENDYTIQVTVSEVVV